VKPTRRKQSIHRKKSKKKYEFNSRNNVKDMIAHFDEIFPGNLHEVITKLIE